MNSYKLLKSKNEIFKNSIQEEVVSEEAESHSFIDIDNSSSYSKSIEDNSNNNESKKVNPNQINIFENII